MIKFYLYTCIFSFVGIILTLYFACKDTEEDIKIWDLLNWQPFVFSIIPIYNLICLIIVMTHFDELCLKIKEGLEK